MGSMGTQPEKIDVKKRRRARFHVIQAVYQREMAGHSLSDSLTAASLKEARNDDITCQFRNCIEMKWN